MREVQHVDNRLGRLSWLSLVLVASLVASIGLPLPVLTSSSVMAAPVVWTQTTLDDFEAGIHEHVHVVLWDPVDPAYDGDVILESNLDQENWGPTQAPNTPKIYGDNYVAQTFRASRAGTYVTVSLYLSKQGNPNNLVVEIWDCTLDDSATAEPKSFLGGGIIQSDDVEQPGEYGASIVVPAPHLSAGTMYAIVVYQQGNSGGPHDYYKWWYDGDYEDGNAWKQTSTHSGWEGAKGFGGHDTTFKVYVSGQPDGKGYYPSGNLTSSVYDTGYYAIFDSISWNSTEPVGTSVMFQIATNNDGATWNFVGPDGASGTFYTTSDSDIWPGHVGYQYIRYKAYLETNDTDETPVLHDVSITYSPLGEPNPSIDMEKYTNGEDADLARGPDILVGQTVSWEYVVTNTGNVPLTDITVSDNVLGEICAIDFLVAGQSVTCNAEGIAIEGQYENVATATGEYNATTVTDSDPSHYYGITGQIYGTVFEDTDGNGILDEGEVGISGVTVTLDGTTNTTTNSIGQYTFADVTAGVHTVVETDPAGYFSTTPNEVHVNVELGSDYEVNFGDALDDSEFASFSGTVFDDKNVNGERDEGELGLVGVTVTISGDFAVSPDTYVTNEWGQYTFTIVNIGTYTITEVDPEGYLSTNAIPGDPAVTRVDENTLRVEVSVLGVDFGNNDFGDVLATGVITISGQVWEDNGVGPGHLANGQLDDDEAGLAGAVVRLSSGLSQTTGTDGLFLLYGPPNEVITVTEINPGSYVIIAEPPDGYVFNHWETEGDLSIGLSPDEESWLCTVWGHGTLRMVLGLTGITTLDTAPADTGTYEITAASSDGPPYTVTFATVPADTGTIKFDGDVYSDGDTVEKDASYISTNAIPGNDASKFDNDTLIVDALSPSSISEGNLFGDVLASSVAILNGTVFDDADGRPLSICRGTGNRYSNLLSRARR